MLQINGKHLDKIIAASVEKVTKKSGDKLKLHVARTIQARSRMCEVKVGTFHWYQLFRLFAINFLRYNLGVVLTESWRQFICMHHSLIKLLHAKNLSFEE